MPLLNFELFPTADISPWGRDDDRSLSWFALTLGTFWIQVGDEKLFEYTDEILAHWGVTTGPKVADYQVAEFVRDFVGCLPAASATLPPMIEALARDRPKLDQLLVRSAELARSDHARWERDLEAGRWLGERCPWTGWLTASPGIRLLRVGDEVQIHWNNEGLEVDGIRVWTTLRGVFEVPVESFRAECEGLVRGLLTAMERRIDALEAGRERAQIPVDTIDLRAQHETWRREFASYFRDHGPDFSWEATEAALRSLADEVGVQLPGESS